MTYGITKTMKPQRKAEAVQARMFPEADTDGKWR